MSSRDQRWHWTHLGEALPTYCLRALTRGGITMLICPMSSDGQFELEEKLDTLSLHPNSSSEHGVSDVDDEKSVNNDERVCQVQSGQMDVLPSTLKAAVAPRPIHQLQLEARSIPSAQTLSAIVERPLAPLGRSSNTHARATTIQPSISAYHINPSSQRQLVRTSDDSRPSTTMSLKMKGRRTGHTLPPPRPSQLASSSP